MSLSETGRYCRTCKKVFCCAECRELHDRKKHSNRHINCPFCCSQKLPLRNVEDEALLCHIVIHHLPLYCCLCGQLFKQSKDLKTFGACKWYDARRRHSLVPDTSSQLETPPPISEHKRPEAFSIDKDDSQQYVSLTPPLLHRQTSTPMIVGQKTGFEYITPSVPNFSLKTPTTNSAISSKSQDRSNNQRSCEATDSNSNFVSFSIDGSHPSNTPFRTPSSIQSSKFDIAKRPNGTSGNEFGNHVTDNHCVEDMELTGIEGNVELNSPNLDVTNTKLEKRVDSIKKVRFSDQFDANRSTTASPTGTFNMTENEEFFEARDSMSETTEQYQSVEEVKILKQTRNNEEKENQSTEHLKVHVNQRTSSSSRVVMILVMENKSELPASDLVPLIDSGLKQLGAISRDSSPSITTNISNSESPKCTTAIVPSVDSFPNRISNYERSSSESILNPSTQLETQFPESSQASNTGGLFSAVARAVKTVMKNFSGSTSSKTVSRQQISQEMVIASSAVETSRTVSNSSLTILDRPGKRPRDTSESVPLTSKSTDLVLPSQPEPRSPLAKRFRSYYRIKGRAPIRSMRSTRVTSPLGISSERQIFSQGSLSVGNTILPLPARAHQSTQTE